MKSAIAKYEPWMKDKGTDEETQMKRSQMKKHR
jgi:hypothetical protein